MRGQAAALPVFLIIVAGCGQTTVTTGGPAQTTPPATDVYDGPLYVTRRDAEHPNAGAAGNVVNCDTWGNGGFSDADVYGEGATANSPEEALDVARGEGGFGGAVEGLRLAKEEEDRVLYVLDVERVVKQAVIVRNGPATEGAGGPGWYVESWAHCDYSELPSSFTDSIGLMVWTDRVGHPLPTTTLESWRGSEHCSWQSMIFLFLGEAEYVRDPLPELADFFAEPYVAHAELPSNAIDTGFQREGDQLWLSPDEQRAYVGTPDDVEVWPRTVRPLLCA